MGTDRVHPLPPTESLACRVEGAVAQVNPYFDSIIFFWSVRRNLHKVSPAFWARLIRRKGKISGKEKFNEFLPFIIV